MEHSHAHHHGTEEPDEPLQWKWIGIGVALGAFLMALLLFLVDPHLERMAAAAYAVGLSVMLSGILVGRMSPGETIRETAIVGVALIAAVGFVSVVFLDVGVPVVAWFFAPLYAAPMTMIGGWVGEMIQGTLPEAAEDEALDWPWVIVSVVVGLVLATFSVMISSTQWGLAPEQSIWLFALSFLVTGIMVGVFSPGKTMIEPAIAAGLMAVVNAGFILVWFGDLPVGRIAVGFGVGTALALVGGVVGEMIQDSRGRVGEVSARGEN